MVDACYLPLPRHSGTFMIFLRLRKTKGRIEEQNVPFTYCRFMKLHRCVVCVLYSNSAARFKQDIAFEDDKTEMMYGLYEMIRAK